ncbi:helicase C-terminal domain-containing protein, partial [Acidithiobacillus thiooxidans]
SREEMYGQDYFRKVMLPLTSRNLVQMAGRLVRRITDSGTITCLDARLGQSSYGKDLLDSLPDFTRDFSDSNRAGAIL